MKQVKLELKRPVVGDVKDTVSFVLIGGAAVAAGIAIGWLGCKNATFKRANDFTPVNVDLSDITISDLGKLGERILAATNVVKPDTKIKGYILDY